MVILQFPPEIFKVIYPKDLEFAQQQRFLWLWFQWTGLALFWKVVVHLFPAARLAQLKERRSAEREYVSSNPGRTINQSL